MVTGLIAEVSSFVTLCNGLKISENGHFTFKPAINSWGARIVVFFVVAGLIAEALLLLFFIRSAV